MSNKSDFSKKQFRINELLPQIFQTEISTSLFQNTVNRHLSKTASQFVDGSIGKLSPTTNTPNRLLENDLARTAYQLQPFIYNKIATLEYIYDFSDIMTMLANTGVDISNMDKWADTQLFNFAPPIDIDKFVNFSDYYWYDPKTFTNPEYITIKNPLTYIRSQIIEKKIYLTTLKNQLAAIYGGDPGLRAEIATIEEEILLLTSQDTTISAGQFGWDQIMWGDSNFELSNLNIYWNQFGITASNTGGLDNIKYPSNAWNSSNKWLHKTDISDFTNAIKAKYPIIEYNQNLELNEWTYTQHNWKYRASTQDAWADAAFGPSDLELINGFTIVSIDTVDNVEAGFEASEFSDELINDSTSVIIAVSGNITNFVSVGQQVSVNYSALNNGQWTVDAIYVEHNNNHDTITQLSVSQPLYVENVEYDSLSGYANGVGLLYALSTTSMGDPWIDFYTHWLYNGFEAAVPVNHQLEMDNVKRYTLSYNKQTIIELPFDYYVGSDTTYVYVNGIRTYIGIYEYPVNQAPLSHLIQVDSSRFQVGDSFTIMVGPRAATDTYRESVIVRIDPVDQLYPGLDTRSLVRYRKVEQSKTSRNQYPLFDIYDIYGNSAYQSNSIFTYTQSNITGVYNTDLNQYITQLSKDYEFSNLLINSSNQLLAYKDYDLISKLNPTGLTLVWKSNTTGARYIPRKVNQYQMGNGDQYTNSSGQTYTTSVDPVNSVWELPPQLYYNYNHECRGTINYSQIYQHFVSIINAQPMPTGYGNTLDKSKFYKLLPVIDFSLSGTIKEHNYSYDLTISSLIQETIQPLSLIHYAADQYDILIEYINQTSTLLLQRVLAKKHNTNTLIAAVLDSLANNDFYNNIFGDSTSYQYPLGVKNWIATLPNFGYSQKTEPMIFTDSKLGVAVLRHHDGHFTNVGLSAEQYTQFITNLNLATSVITTATLPQYDSTMVFGSLVYVTSTNKLYTSLLKQVSTATPVASYIFNNGDIWLNPNTGVTYVYNNSTWSVTTDPAILWKYVDVSTILMDVLYQIEYDLYKVSIEPLYNYTSFISQSELQTFYTLLQAQYDKFVNSFNYNISYNDYNISNPFTYNYSNFALASVRIPTTAKTAMWFARYIEIYEYYFNTRYPHLEPWKLQLFEAKPSWWDDYYADTTGLRKWSQAMWDNIKAGVLPVGITSTLILPKYLFVCVNTSNNQILSYAPDDLLPPYFNGQSDLENEVFLTGSLIGPITNFLTEIATPYSFGQGGPVEQTWKDSTYYRYDILSALYLLQPIKFMHTFFGYNYSIINGMNVCTLTQNVMSHNQTVFHGEIYNGKMYLALGINQWYVNYLRAHSTDLNLSNFNLLWKGWATSYGYKTNRLVDSKSLQLSTSTYDITKNDYNVSLKKSAGVNDIHVAGFYVSVDTAGTGIFLSGHESQLYQNAVIKIPTNDASDWTFDITFINYIKPISYYGVNNYHATDIVNNGFILDGTPAWINGTLVMINTTSFTPFNSNSSFYIVRNNNGYSIALSPQDAEAGNIVDLNLSVVQIISPTQPTTFNRYDFWTTTDANNNVIVYQYNIVTQTWDQCINNLIKLPYNIGTSEIVITNGPFTLINDVDYIIRGNIVQFTSSPVYFPALTIIIKTDLSNLHVYEPVNSFLALGGAKTDQLWNHYTINKHNVKTITSRQFKIIGLQNVINFVDGLQQYYIDSGIIFNNFEYSADTDIATGRIISWQLELEKLIDNVYAGMYGTYQLLTITQNQLAMYHEMNPFKYDIWVNTDLGMVSNILYGPFTDINTQPIVYDQFGRTFSTVDNLKIYRQDLQTHISYPKVDQIYPNESHIGGLHLYFDEYEHVILFNDYTLADNLIYDSFVGLAINSFNISMNRSDTITSRPSYGGYFLDSSRNSVQNVEATVSNIRLYYDTYNANETSDYIDNARGLLGYQPSWYDYMAPMNLSNKTKFSFYRGMIRHKGTTNSITAFTNYNGFHNASIDEFWALKLGEFGELREKSTKFLNVLVSDVTQNDDLLYYFSKTRGGQGISGYTTINNADNLRWYNINDSLQALQHNFETKFTPLEFNVVQYPNSANQYLQFASTFNELLLMTPAYEYEIPVNMVGGNIIPLYHFINDSSEVEVRINNQVVSCVLSGEMLFFQNTHGEINSVHISYFPTTFVENVDYFILNNTCVKLGASMLTLNVAQNLIAVDVSFDYMKHHHISLIDTLNNITVVDIPYYHPANGIYHPSIQQNVDLITNTDPAAYTNSTNNITPKTNIWGYNEVGTIWWDTSNVSYMPYENRHLFNRLPDILQTWGRVQDWCTIDIYQWTQSSLLPQDYEKTDATVNQNDISNNEKITGTVYKQYYYNQRDTTTSNWNGWHLLADTVYITNPYRSNIENDVYILYLDDPSFDPTIWVNPVTDITIFDKDIYVVYQNGLMLTAGSDYTIALSSAQNISSITFHRYNLGDEIRIVVPATYPSLQDVLISQSNVTALIQYRIETPYVELYNYDSTGTVGTPIYFYWVKDKIAVVDGKPATSQLANIILNPTDPYYFVDNLSFIKGSYEFNELLVRNVGDYITNSSNYQLLMRTDFSATETSDTNISLQKISHTNWIMFREQQPTAIDQNLWNKITESMVGTTLDQTTPIPSLSRVIYDNLNSTTFRYGYGIDQCAGDAAAIISIVLSDLRDPSNNFLPINKQTFLETYSFSNPASIIAGMNYLYEFGNSADINRIFFKVLNETYVNTPMVQNIMKTSMIALQASQQFITASTG